MSLKKQGLFFCIGQNSIIFADINLLSFFYILTIFLVKNFIFHKTKCGYILTYEEKYCSFFFATAYVQALLFEKMKEKHFFLVGTDIQAVNTTIIFFNFSFFLITGTANFPLTYINKRLEIDSILEIFYIRQFVQNSTQQ